MSMGYEKTILLYSSATYETADIISSYIYRVGLQDAELELFNGNWFA